MSIHLTVNGEERQVPRHTSVTGLLQTLEIPAVRVAVEHNRRILRRDDFAATTLEDGDRIEIVQFVGGG